MAEFRKITLSSTEWTLISEDADWITFQNSGQTYIYIKVTSANTTPSESFGVSYKPLYGEMKVSPVDLGVESGTFVWARSASGEGEVIVEDI